MNKESITISSIQTSLYWEDKVLNLAMLAGKISLCPETDIIVLPEMFSTGFSMQPEKFAESLAGHTIQWLQAQAKQKKSIITGSIIIEDNGNYYNRMIWMEPTGQFSFYDKRHLFAYAGEDEHYSSGKERKIVTYCGWNINLQVCYDLRFPVWARQTTQHENTPEYDLIIYIANWPERRSNAWKILLQARAIENQAFVIGVNRTGTDGNNIYHSGNSMCIHPTGLILAHYADDEKIFTTTLSKQPLLDTRTKFPFYKDSDKFSLE